MSPSKKPQTPFRLPASVRARLEFEAARLETSLNAVVVQYLDRYLPPLPTPGAQPAPAPEPDPVPAPAPSTGAPLDFD